MKLRRFGLSHFRTIVDKTYVDFSDYTILIGQNNQGKTNFLLAVKEAYYMLWRYRPLRNGVGRIGADTVAFFEENYPKRLSSDKTLKTEFELYFELSEQEIKCFADDIGLANNGKLQLRISLEMWKGKEDGPRFSIESFGKRGKGGSNYNKKIREICQFIRRHFFYRHVPAIRTEEDARRIVSELIRDNMQEFLDSEEYFNIIQKLEGMREEAANKSKDKLLAAIQTFTPIIKNVRINFPYQDLTEAFNGDSDVFSPDIILNDGNETPLDQKGDGISSLLVMALIQAGQSSDTLIAFEEPESHLHADAMHLLNQRLVQISKTKSIIITTHNPSFVSPSLISSTYIVRKEKITVAKDTDEIRRELGLAGGDALFLCDKILFVEGPSDETILKKVFELYAPELIKLIEEKELQFFVAHGVSKIPFYARISSEWVHDIFAILDNDDSGKAAYSKIKEGVGSFKSFLLPPIRGKRQTEIEDILPPDIVSRALQSNHLPCQSNEIKSSRAKFNDYIDGLSRRNGQILSDDDKNDIKKDVADLFASSIHNKGEIIDSKESEIWQSLVNAVKQAFHLIDADPVGASADKFEMISIFGDGDF